MELKPLCIASLASNGASNRGLPLTALLTSFNGALWKNFSKYTVAHATSISANDDGPCDTA